MTDINARWLEMQPLVMDIDAPDALDAIDVCQACCDFDARIPGWLKVFRVAKCVRTCADRFHVGDRRDIADE